MLTALRSRSEGRRERNLDERAGWPRVAERLLEEALRDLEDDLHRFADRLERVQATVPMVHDRDDAWVWHVDVPDGFRRRDLDVEVAGDRVVARVERAPRWFRRRSGHRSWRAEVRLSAVVGDEDVRASWHDGRLEVVVPKPPRLRRVRIPVRTA